MKNPSHKRSPKGFTLVELLVVIAIIAVLAAAGFSVGPAMIDRAKKLTAQTTAVAISTSVEQFYSEYSALPDPASNSVDAEFDTKSASGRDLLEGLVGIDTDMNPKKLRCLSIKEAKNKQDGIVFGPNGDDVVALYDAWGQPFTIRLDYDYDERLSFTPKGSKQIDLNGRKVAVWSLGVKNPADTNAKKLVKSW